MDSFLWTSNFPEIQKMCRLFDLTENPVKYSYTRVVSVLQKGPQCGLVALAMITNEPNENTVNKLMEIAVKQGYTYNGEIFSASDMCELARTVLCDQNVQLYEGNLNDNKVKEFLLNGGFLLVPYPFSVPFKFNLIKIVQKSATGLEIAVR